MRQFPNLFDNTLESIGNWIKEVTRIRDEDVGDTDKINQDINDAGTVDLTTEVSGVLPVANGGTGAATHTAKGVLIGQGTSALTTVAPGTSGNVLKSNGTDWVSAAGLVASGYSVGQIQITTLLTTHSTTSTTMTNTTGLAVSITPTSTSSIVLVIANGACGASSAVTTQMFEIANNTTPLLSPDTPSSRQAGMVGTAGLAAGDLGHFTVIGKDAPNSTSSQTYNLRHLVDTGTGYINRSGTDTDSASFQRGTSMIMAIELRPIT